MKNKSGKKKPSVNLTLVSERIGPVKIDRKFRAAMTKIVEFWSKNRKKRNLLISAVYYDAIVKCMGIRLFHRLKTKWVAEADQEIEAYYHADVLPQLRKVLRNYQKSKKKGAKRPPSRKRCI